MNVMLWPPGVIRSTHLRTAKSSSPRNTGTILRSSGGTSRTSKVSNPSAGIRRSLPGRAGTTPSGSNSTAYSTPG